MSKNVIARNNRFYGLGGSSSADLQNILDTVRPVNSTYIQFPNLPDPNEIFNSQEVKSVWEKIEFNGAFFRAEGGNAQPFDNQEDAQADMIKAHSHSASGTIQNLSVTFTASSGAGITQGTVSTSSVGGLETRPVNYTIVIWKRVS